MKPSSISKILSLNDTGQTGGHQAGILIPKEGNVLDFFPTLDSKTKNPRVVIHFKDETMQIWKFSFIYYNSRFFGGTRNEYRLTGMTKYINQYNLKAGDTAVLTRLTNDDHLINFQKPQEVEENHARLRVSGSWKVIQY